MKEVCYSLSSLEKMIVGTLLLTIYHALTCLPTNKEILHTDVGQYTMSNSHT